MIEKLAQIPNLWLLLEKQNHWATLGLEQNHLATLGLPLVDAEWNLLPLHGALSFYLLLPSNVTAVHHLLGPRGPWGLAFLAALGLSTGQ